MTTAVLELPFSCHKKTSNVTDLTRKDVPQCVGRLKYATKMAKRFRDQDLEIMRKEFDDEDLLDVMSLDEFMKHHSYC